MNRKQEKILLARFEAGRQMYNALLGEAKRRLALMRQSVLYQTAQAISPKDENRRKERQAYFRTARQTYGFSEYSLSQYATQLRKSWLGEHLDAHVAQKLAKRAFEAVEKMAYRRAKNVRFKGKRGIRSLEGKSNTSGIRWRDNRVEWRGLSLPMVQKAKRDSVIQHGLKHRVKYVRLVRRTLRGKERFYAQLVLKGLPYRKSRHVVGSETVGLDIGPSTIAIVGDTKASLEQFCEPIVRDHRYIRRLQRKVDRQRRANNPDCYDEKGRNIKGKRPTKKSRRQLQTERKLAEYQRKEKEHRKTLQGELANRILAIGADIRCEDISYRAFQKRFGCSVGLRAPGLFISILQRKAESAGGEVRKCNTRTTALSQMCVCGVRRKKALSERIHRCSCGVTMQRDLFSAYLVRHVQNDRLQVSEAKRLWTGAEPLLRMAWKQATQNNQLASGQAMPSSFGRYRSRSESSEKGKTAATKARNVVTCPTGESPREVKAVLPRTPCL